MAMIEQITDEEIREALIKSNGQPTKAAEILDISYPHLYTRIRKNPELLEIQKAYRARVFQSVSNLTLTTFLTGVMKSPAVDEEGEIIKDENGQIIYKDVYVDTRTRLGLAPNLMQTFKSDEGIKEELEITTKGSINISDWLKLNNQNADTDTESI